MNRNFAALLTVSLLFGLGLGIYEFALPYFLDSHGISVPSMGLIYAAGALLVFVVRIYAGHLSDRVGRKTLYSSAVGLSAIVSAVTPITAVLWIQAVLKSVREAGVMVFDSMYQLALHDESRTHYLDRMGKTRGLQYLAEALGTFATGLLLVRAAYTGSFRLSAALFCLGLIVFVWGYRPRNNLTPPASPQSLSDVFALDLPRPLVVLTVFGFIFTLGLSISHCFVMQLFWSRQFGASMPLIGIILMLHRLTIALPMLFVGWAVKKRLKEIFIIFVSLEGLALLASGLIPGFLSVAIVWLTHDLFGAGVWVPIQSTLIQRYAREETRGRDVSKVYAIGSLGWIFGPLIAGAIFEHWYGGPFVLSGIIGILSALVLFRLPAEDIQLGGCPAGNTED